MEPDRVAANIERFMGFADRYDSYRPHPPTVLLELLPQLAGQPRPHRVVDLGSGTGLSTRFWAGHADEIIGVEPGRDMRRRAEEVTAGRPEYANVQYREGLGKATVLPDACADIVTCSQSLHWMEPEPTLAEVARILRPGGVMAAYDCDWPPTVQWEAEQAYIAFVLQGEALGRQLNATPGSYQWDKEGHLARMEASGHFRYVKQVVVHGVEPGDGERLIGLALSQGRVAKAFEAGASEEETGLVRFREIVSRTLGTGAWPFYFSYRVRVGVK